MHIIHFILYHIILCCSMYIILHIYIYKDTMGTYIGFYFSILGSARLSFGTPNGWLGNPRTKWGFQHSWENQ